MTDHKYARSILKYLYFRVKNALPQLEPLIKDAIDPKLFSRQLAYKFIKKFNGKLGHGAVLKEDYYTGLGMLHYALIRTLRPKNILCIGSMRGFIPAILAQACKDNRYGKVHFVDAGFDARTNLKAWGNDGFWRKIETSKHFNGLSSQWLTFYLLTSKKYCETYPQRQYDYIYIDGDHSYEGVKSDYKLYWPQLKNHGFLLFHDIQGKGNRYGLEFGVEKFWKELPDNHKVSINFPQESGLGILQKN